MSKELVKAALTRAERTFLQTLGSTIPVGVVITTEMIKNINIDFLYAILAWIGTGLLAGLISFLTCISTGLPEVNNND